MTPYNNHCISSPINNLWLPPIINDQSFYRQQMTAYNNHYLLSYPKRMTLCIIAIVFRRYMAKILSTRRRIPSNQSINQPNHNALLHTTIAVPAILFNKIWLHLSLAILQNVSLCLCPPTMAWNHLSLSAVRATSTWSHQGLHYENRVVGLKSRQ